MIQVYLTSSSQEAEHLRMLLRQKGISSSLDNEHSSKAATAVPLIISVADQDESNAVQVIRDYLARSNLEP
jgi:hypothetical protein